LDVLQKANCDQSFAVITVFEMDIGTRRLLSCSMNRKTLPMDNIPISIIYHDMLLTGYAQPLEDPEDIIPSSLSIYIQGWCLGTLRYCNNKWLMDQPIDTTFIELLGSYIYSYIRLLKKQ
jgi:hypothetical protein